MTKAIREASAPLCSPCQSELWLTLLRLSYKIPFTDWRICIPKILFSLCSTGGSLFSNRTIRVPFRITSSVNVLVSSFYGGKYVIRWPSRARGLRVSLEIFKRQILDRNMWFCLFAYFYVLETLTRTERLTCWIRGRRTVSGPFLPTTAAGFPSLLSDGFHSGWPLGGFARRSWCQTPLPVTHAFVPLQCSTIADFFSP